MPRFPTRTLVLMCLALVAFAWMWWRTHQLRATAPVAVVTIKQTSGVGTLGAAPPADGGAP